MRAFVGEYICGGGLADEPVDQIPASLRLEGRAMLTALVADLAQVVQTVIPIDSRLIDEITLTKSCAQHANSNAASTDEHDPAEFAISPLRIDASQPVWNQWIESAKDCDVALIIAPESDGILTKAVSMLRHVGVCVIAGSDTFLQTASDKLLTAQLFHEAGVPHPPCFTLTDTRHSANFPHHARWIVKPRDGCGCQNVQLFDSLGDARDSLDARSIVQPWVPGRAASIAMIASGEQKCFLPAVSQTILPQTCQYSGGAGPLNDDSQRRATVLASRAIQAMPATVSGFVGIDIVLGDEPAGDTVIEINPRLTMSYVGLRRIVSGNLAARILGLETGDVTCNPSIRSVRWTAEGKVSIHSSFYESGIRA